MRQKCGFLVGTLALLSFFVFLTPLQARADTLPTNFAATSPGVVPGAQPINTPNCPGAANGGNGLDNLARSNLTAFTQALFAAAHNVNTMFPVAPAMNQCLTTLMNAFSALPGLADPLGVAGAAVAGLLTGIVGQICSQIMGEVTSVQNSLLNMTKICLPMPSFGGIDLPQWNQQGCSGGLQLNFLTGFAAPSSNAIYNYSQYLQ